LLFTRKPRFTKDDLPSLLQACLAGDERAHYELIRQFAGFAKSVCMRYAAHPQEADEIINDGFLKVFTHLTRYDQTQSFEAWLRTVMVNTAVDYYRKKQKWAGEVGLEGIDVADWNDDIISAISAREILALVQQLPTTYRIVFTLFVVDGYSHTEIAAMLGIQEGTSRSNLRDARRKLQSMIKQNHPALYQQYTWPHQRYNEN
jgi:RNA polymerase sigma-70 factor (ECF subfamily)